MHVKYSTDISYSTCVLIGYQFYGWDNFCWILFINHSAGTVINTPCKVNTPFPHIFKKNVNKFGLVSTTERSRFQGKVYF